ncbi:hypothetical protein BpHYR1_035764 [Brachionus plicatilis]|uniref:Uncharacterized protein n=1 Tax=Brachionus plicatilis TaxID=10195 RepID=A0A3M7Q8C4_BRAPC|nr:hypothetical protein BpHYR1_035764 [Brachionus plicatilis]
MDLYGMNWNGRMELKWIELWLEKSLHIYKSELICLELVRSLLGYSGRIMDYTGIKHILQISSSVFSQFN